MRGLFKVYFKDSARPYNEILASCCVNYSSSDSPTANYYFKGLIHLKISVPFFPGEQSLLLWFPKLSWLKNDR